MNEWYHNVFQEISLSIRKSLFFFFLPPVVLLPLIDRMGDAKDQVREQAQNLILKLMDEAAPPMVCLLNVDSHVGLQ